MTMGLRAGQVVGIPVGDRVVAATVLEDRGPVGVGGEQVVRLALGRDVPSPAGYRLELPASALVAPPDAPPGADGDDRWPGAGDGAPTGPGPRR